MVDEWMEKGHGKRAFFDALKAMEAAGELVQTTDKPKLLHLNRAAEAEADPETDAA